MKDLILIKTLISGDYYLTTCPVFDEYRGKDLRDFKQDLKDAYEAVTLENCKAWFVSDINPKDFHKAKEDFFRKCCDKYGLEQSGDTASNSQLYVNYSRSQVFGNYIKMSYWTVDYTAIHISIELNKYNGYLGLSFRGVPESQAAEFLGMWIESCLNN